MPMDRKEAQEVWEVLGRAMDEIYNRNASQLSFEELYRNAYNLVLHKYGAFLYERVTENMTRHLSETVEQLQETQGCLLQAMSDAWKDHQMTSSMIRDILMYLDRTFVTQQHRRPVYELGLHLFRVTVWEHPAVCKEVTELILATIHQERMEAAMESATSHSEGNNANTNSNAATMSDARDKVKAILRMLLELQQTDSSSNTYCDLEQVLLGTTQEFYHQESLQYLSQHTAMDYVWKAMRRIQEEKDRCAALQLPGRTEAPLMALVQTELIERHAKALVDMDKCGFRELLATTDKLNDMRDMYDLFARVPSSVDFLREALSDRIKKDGRALIDDQQKGAAAPAAFVRGVLDMREKYDQIVQISFRHEKKAQKRMSEAFEDFLNTDARAASCLAVYVDELLRQGLRGATEEQMQQELEKALLVFRYLQDKDVFESFYKQHLAKRLLFGRSISDDAERTMVSLLKAECGYQFTTKIEGMFTDIRISRETRDKYKNYQRQHGEDRSGIDIEVDVLTTGYWPSQNVPPCTLPASAQDAIGKFEKFYLERHTGRKLSWQTSAGSAEIRATFGAPPNLRRYDLCVSTYQMVILILYNEKDVFTLGQIRTMTHIPDSELRRQLISLTTPRNKILIKGSKGKGITSDDDTFTFNHEYTSKLKRVRIPLVKETSLGPRDGTAGAQGGDVASGDGIDGSVPVAVEEDRRHLVEAAIVRIMKARKTLSHNDLVAEVTKQLSIRFNPSPVFIKKRIESLIEREYLERSPDEHRLYTYVA
jgi:cullin 3